jgi:hypothetical protein
LSERVSATSIQIERLLTEREYTTITGESVATARRNRLLKIGCPFIKLNHLVRYDPADVRRYIEANRRGTDDRRRPEAQ